MPNILVVDDSTTQLTFIAAVLRQHGATVQTASNGREALDVLQNQGADLVVTDMQMPEMNGVELIRKMREKFPLVPSVLVTAFGNEDLASEALGVGAANYISKDHVSVLLPDMIARITQFAAANAQSLDLKGTLTRTSFEFLLDCAIERVTSLVALLVRMLASMNVLHTGERIRIAEALDHLLMHAILHGNLEEPVQALPWSREQWIAIVDQKRNDPVTQPMTERLVTLQTEVKQREARFVVTHQGNGQSIHHAPLPGTPESFSDERARAMLLLTSVMNEVFIDPVSGDVTLVKYIAR